jgi:tetratricopeptide (TPR) repeat protein
MVIRWPYLLLALLLLTLVAAEEHRVALVKGYQAYQQGDYDVALREYETALQQSSDPGYFALELGSIAAQAGRYSEAAAWFSRCLEDARNERQQIATYGQATALTHLAVMQQGKRGVTTLERAIAGYRQAIEQHDKLQSGDKPSAKLVAKSDIEHNMNLAVALLQQKKQEPEPPEPDQQPENSPPSNLGNDGNGPGASRTGSMQGPRGNEGSANETNNNAPGRGNLPALPDDEKVPPISPEEADRRLQQLLARLRQPLTTTPMKPGTRDW